MSEESYITTVLVSKQFKQEPPKNREPTLWEIRHHTEFWLRSNEEVGTFAYYSDSEMTYGSLKEALEDFVFKRSDLVVHAGLTALHLLEIPEHHEIELPEGHKGSGHFEFDDPSDKVGPDLRAQIEEHTTYSPILLELASTYMHHVLDYVGDAKRTELDPFLKPLVQAAVKGDHEGAMKAWRVLMPLIPVNA